MKLLGALIALTLHLSGVSLGVDAGTTGSFVRVCTTNGLEELCDGDQPFIMDSGIGYGTYGDPGPEMALANQAGLNTVEADEFGDPDNHDLGDITAAATWTRLWAWIDAAQSHGLHVLLNLSEYGQALCDAGIDPFTPTALASDWGPFLSFVAGNEDPAVPGQTIATDPTIAMIEIWGEVIAPNGDGLGQAGCEIAPASTQQLTDFYATTLDDLRSDDPDQLLSTGGFSFLNEYPDPPGSGNPAGIDYRSIFALANNDVCDVEDNSEGDQTVGVPLAAAYCGSRGPLAKPWLLSAWSACYEPATPGYQDFSSDAAMAAHARTMYQLAATGGQAHENPSTGTSFWSLRPTSGQTVGCGISPAFPETFAAVTAGQTDLTVTGVDPASGPADASAPVTVTGTGFSTAPGATAVDFGSVPATDVTCRSSSACTVERPEQAPGAEPVTATVAGETSADAATFTDDPVSAGGGYDLVGSDGGVFVFPPGGGHYFGSLPGLGVHVDDIVGMVPSADDMGYFLVGRDGGVFSFGDARYEGSLPGLGVAADDITGIVPTADDRGYLLVGSDGGVFSLGDARYLGSLPGQGVHIDDITGITATPDDGGYWIVASTGAVYAFGDARDLGDGAAGSSPVTGIAATPDGLGYWVVSADGAVQPMGDAANLGDLPSRHVSPGSPIRALVPTPDGLGYWLIGSDGGVFSFGDAGSDGSLPGLGVTVADVVGAAPTAG